MEKLECRESLGMFIHTHTHSQRADITYGVQVFLYYPTDALTYHLSTAIFHPQQ